jgi:uncharacterized membrane protein (UPF0127 family)/uncharacterized protein YdhG (YjbR/CyaY superfamily)
MKYQKFSHKTPHLKGKQHQLDPNLDLKQLVHHSTVQYVDRDADGDVDVYDNPKKKTPDENPTGVDAETLSKKLIAKQKGELKHTKRGLAYEETKSGDDSLHDWFTKSRSSDGTPGWVQLGGKYAGKPCAKQPGQTTKPKCGSSKMKRDLDKGEEETAFRRKNRKDPNPERRGASINVKTEEKEEVRYCTKCKKMETRDECSYGPEMWDKMTVKGVSEAVKDHEYSMARSELSTVMSAAKRLKKKMKNGEGEIEAWVQSKITKAADYLDSAADYVDSGEMKEDYTILPLQIEIPTNIRDFNLGLMFRESLEQNSGMLFIFDEVAKQSFHMTETRIPLDIAFINEEGIIESIKELEPFEETPVSSEGEVICALEVNRGWFEQHNIEVGDEIDIEEASGEKDACYSKVKSRYKVWPSAYASGALVKCRKVGAANWGNKTKKEETIQDANGNTFAEVIDLIKPDPIKKVEESVRIPSKTGNIILVTLTWRGKYYAIKMFFPQVTKPTKKDVQDQIEKVYPGSKVQSFYISDIKPGEQLLQVEDWQKVNRQDKTDGLSQKAVDAYRRENPGSKLQTAVTEKKPSGKRAARRKSFCSRMKGMKKRLTSSETARDPDSRINKALRRWNCN